MIQLQIHFYSFKNRGTQTVNLPGTKYGSWTVKQAENWAGTYVTWKIGWIMESIIDCKMGWNIGWKLGWNMGSKWAVKWAGT